MCTESYNSEMVIGRYLSVVQALGKKKQQLFYYDYFKYISQFIAYKQMYIICYYVGTF